MSHLKQANDAFREQDYQKAVELYNLAVTESPLLKPMVEFNLKQAQSKMTEDKSYSVFSQPSQKKEIKYYSKDHPAVNYLMNHQVYTVDIVVPVYNALEDVKRCLEAIHRHTDGFRITTYIVNDASDRETTDYLREFCQFKPSFVLIEHETNMMYTKTVNDGLKATTADYVITLNSDTIVTKGWLQGLVRCMRSDSQIGVVGPLSNAASWQNVPVLLDKDNLFAVNDIPNNMTPDEMAEFVNRVSQQAYPRVPFVNGFCFMISRQAIERVGFLDEKTFPTGYGEENDYCLRVAEAGFTLAIADDSYVFHAKSKSFGHEKRKEYSKNGSAALREKHGSQKISESIERLKRLEDLNVFREKFKISLESKNRAVSLSNLKILFILPVNGGGGGAHSVVQEVNAMRQVGVKAQIAMKPPQVIKFINDYPNLKDSEDIFVGFSNESELLDIAQNYDIVVATVYTTVRVLKNIISVHSHIMPAYYIQDYEPMFFDKYTPQWGEAYQSYTLIQNCFLFAKTKWIVDKVQNNHHVKVHKVNPSIDHDMYKVAVKENENIVISAMIRPKTPYRGAKRTMEVLRRVYEKHKDKIEIVLFGVEESDPLFQELERNFKYCNHGVLTQNGVAKILQKSDIFLELSDYQAFGRTALEAMACGCTVVETKHGGVKEYAQHEKNCLLVDPFNSEDVFDALDTLILDKDKLVSFRNEGLLTASRYNPKNAALSELTQIVNAFSNHNRFRQKSTKPTLFLLPSMRGDGLPAGSGYVRVVLPYKSKFLQKNFHVKVTPTKLPEPGTGDFALIQRDAASFSLDELQSWLPLWKRSGGKLIFEIDDDLLNKQGLLQRGYKGNFEELVKKVSYLASNANTVTVSTEPLQNLMSKFNSNVVVVPNCLDEDLWQLKTKRNHESGDFARKSDVVRIGYIGTNTHQEDLDLIASSMNKIKEKYQGKVEIEVIGAFQNHPIKFGKRVALPSKTDYPSFVEWLLKRVHWDIGVIPLVEDDFNKSKSNLKFLEYSALDMAIVASDVKSYRNVIKDEVNSISIENNSEWQVKIEQLIESKKTRDSLANEARKNISDNFTLENLDLIFEELFFS